MSDTSGIILLTNDDGIHAEGLRYAKLATERLGEPWIVAPEAERSAVGHAITLYDPIKVHEISHNGEFFGYGIGGTPADAVKLAIHALLPQRPRLVVAGINNGANLGINVLYSGTISAATEGAILGVPSMAVSLAQKKNPPYHWAIPHVETLARWVLRTGLPEGVALSVNVPVIPPEEVRGYKLTKQALGRFNEKYERREDPRGNVYFWPTAEVMPNLSDDSVDVVALQQGFISVTPLFYDLTAHMHVRDLAQSLESL
jgi:5'-nucleotidase